ncbi:hypothetical protein FDG2_5137 [Candidatus Protofrankia californiensis]|uniref:Uncharacterized protein n=1 Tax=Candidatus Protofrankia californiensis TaxID=1839754 RepID=A0A1C3PB76_9ACTN|nr:hypothetical protein FDG2_5137 [Candidatus Protofrankia californiensis]
MFRSTRSMGIVRGRGPCGDRADSDLRACGQDQSVRMLIRKVHHVPSRCLRPGQIETPCDQRVQDRRRDLPAACLGSGIPGDVRGLDRPHRVRVALDRVLKVTREVWTADLMAASAPPTASAPRAIIECTKPVDGAAPVTASISSPARSTGRCWKTSRYRTSARGFAPVGHRRPRYPVRLRGHVLTPVGAADLDQVELRRGRGDQRHVHDLVGPHDPHVGGVRKA